MSLWGDREAMSFVSAIAKSRDDQHPRMVLADWLNDNRPGVANSLRADLIRLQCQAERLGIYNSCRRFRMPANFDQGWVVPCRTWFGTNSATLARNPPAEMREAEMIWQKMGWLFKSFIEKEPALLLAPPAVLATVLPVTFANGFVESVCCHISVWLKYGCNLLACNPLREVYLYGATDSGGGWRSTTPAIGGVLATRHEMNAWMTYYGRSADPAVSFDVESLDLLRKVNKFDLCDFGDTGESAVVQAMLETMLLSLWPGILFRWESSIKVPFLETFERQEAALEKMKRLIDTLVGRRTATIE